MNSQIFKERVPLSILYSLLDTISVKRDNHYLIDMNAYKKMVYSELHVAFFESLKPYYHKGKYFYLERKLTYNSFTTIVRQICKHEAVMFTSKINYNQSKYNIDYTIFFDKP